MPLAKIGPTPGVIWDMANFQQVLYVSFKQTQVSDLGPLGPLVLITLRINLFMWSFLVSRIIFLIKS